MSELVSVLEHEITRLARKEAAAGTEVLLPHSTPSPAGRGGVGRGRPDRRLQDSAKSILRWGVAVTYHVIVNWRITLRSVTQWRLA